jgi:hypothetical protein
VICNQQQNKPIGFKTNPSLTPPLATASTPNVEQGIKRCEYCATKYVYKIHNQKFCSEKCRITNWNQKTGRTFKKGKK